MTPSYRPIASLIIALVVSTAVSARVVEYDLTVAEQKLSPAGKPVRVLTINGGIPGPVLRFQEGDFARIRVHNQLVGEETSIHWHGILLPNEQDGVPHVTTPPILPGTTHTFEFPIRQSGTYWYHSHTHLQEQSGVYGSIVIIPRGGEPHAAARDHVLQMSDWTNEDPHEVHRSLLRGTEYYALKKGNMQSLLGAAKAGALKDYLNQMWTRMPPMDISDVAYDAFLINGQRSSRLPGKPGERIRLRLINSGSSTYFYVTSATGPMTIVAADGLPVTPVKLDRILMGMAETYDVLVTVPGKGAWEVRATAQDGSGHASTWIGDGAEEHAASDPPKPNIYSMEEMMGMAMMDMDEDSGHDMQSMPRPPAPYDKLRAPRSTALPKGLPVRTIPLSLTGDMERYQWSFNGKTLSEESTIFIRRGEVVRLEMINDTMMHHPIHLHGHFFRLINKHGERSPLKHTVDMPPMASQVIEFEANEKGDWLFHCHLLYHMMAGMGRIFSYEGGPDGMSHAGSGGHSHHTVNPGEHAHDPWMFWGEGSVQSHMTEGMLDLRRSDHDFYAVWEAGWQDVDDFDYEADLIYEHYFNPNVRAFGGARLTNDDDAENRAILGARYRLPLLIWSTASLDSEGDLRIGLAKSLQITSRLSFFGEVEYDTSTEWEWSAGAAYTINKPVSLITQYHSEYGFGGGLSFRF